MMRGQSGGQGKPGGSLAIKLPIIRVTVHGQKWRNYKKNATFYLALPVYRDFYVL
jgi:hypothetical protein